MHGHAIDTVTEDWFKELQRLAFEHRDHLHRVNVESYKALSIEIDAHFAKCYDNLYAFGCDFIAYQKALIGRGRMSDYVDKEKFLTLNGGHDLAWNLGLMFRCHQVDLQTWDGEKRDAREKVQGPAIEAIKASNMAKIPLRPFPPR